MQHKFPLYQVFYSKSWLASLRTNFNLVFDMAEAGVHPELADSFQNVFDKIKQTAGQSFIKVYTLDNITPLIHMLQEIHTSLPYVSIRIVPEGQIQRPWPSLRFPLAPDNVYNNFHGFIRITLLRPCHRTEPLNRDFTEVVVCGDRIGGEECLTVDTFGFEGAGCYYEYFD
jgi:hypothetical protein